jgi:hypothetical protein
MPRPAATNTGTGRVGTSYDPPPLIKPPSYFLAHRDFPKHHGLDLSLILTIAVLVAMAAFFVALVVGAVTSSGG